MGKNKVVCDAYNIHFIKFGHAQNEIRALSFSLLPTKLLVRIFSHGYAREEEKKETLTHITHEV